LGLHGIKTTNLLFSRQDFNRSATEALREKVAFDHYLNQVSALTQQETGQAIEILSRKREVSGSSPVQTQLRQIFKSAYNTHSNILHTPLYHTPSDKSHHLLTVLLHFLICQVKRNYTTAESLNSKQTTNDWDVMMTMAKFLYKLYIKPHNNETNIIITVIIQTSLSSQSLSSLVITILIIVNVKYNFSTTIINPVNNFSIIFVVLFRNYFSYFSVSSVLFSLEEVHLGGLFLFAFIFYFLHL